MKHIKFFNQKLKLFEGYLDKQPSYNLIGGVYYNKFLLSESDNEYHTIPFTENEISKMKEIYSENHDHSWIKKFIVTEPSHDDKGLYTISIHYGTSGKPHYDNVIEYQNYFKVEDHWYYLYHNGRGIGGKWFKCDQFEGLIKCMKDNRMKF